MHIKKAETKNFADYEVIEIVKAPNHENLWQFLVRRLLRKPLLMNTVEIPVTNVVEANDATGLLTYQLTDDRGRPIFSNGQDDIVLDNAVKTLLLLNNIRAAFHSAGFRPKLSTQYKDGLRIHYHGPQQIVNVQTTEIAESDEVTA